MVNVMQFVSGKRGWIHIGQEYLERQNARVRIEDALQRWTDHHEESRGEVRDFDDSECDPTIFDMIIEDRLVACILRTPSVEIVELFRHVDHPGTVCDVQEDLEDALQVLAESGEAEGYFNKIGGRAKGGNGEENIAEDLGTSEDKGN